ncbi:hypothetical protein SLITK23_21680 [Streptomyces lividans]|nr:hypothetical protein SLITK23_21680 [Streptomyces lividans]
MNPGARAAPQGAPPGSPAQPLASPVHGLRPQALSAHRGVCEHEGKAEGQDTGPSRNESAVPPVGTVGKQSPYNPGEM